jgi:excisionase family DNA binding protein
VRVLIHGDRMQEKLVTTKEAAVLLGVSEAFLHRDRWDARTIPFVRVGTRAVRYELADIESFIASRKTRSAARQNTP